MKRLKGFIFTSLLVTVLSSTMVFAGTDINVTLNGNAVQFTDAVPYVDNSGRTMMPVAKMGELLGVQVGWDNTTQTVSLKDGTKVVSLKIGSNILNIDGTPTTMDTKAVIKDGRTYVPLSAIAKAFGVTAGWDKATSTVSLKSSKVDTKVPNSTTNSEDIEFKAELASDPNDITYKVSFRAEASEPVFFYFLIAEKEYFEANDFTAVEMKQIIEDVEKRENGFFEAEDYYGVFPKTPHLSTTTSFGLPDHMNISGEEYVAKVFGVTESGEFTDVVDVEFTPSPKVTAEVVEITDNQLTLKASSVRNVQYYFVVGESEDFEDDVTVEELKEIADNAVATSRDSFFNTDKYFGNVGKGYYGGSKVQMTIPAGSRNGKEYTAKIFGITQSGYPTEIVSLEFVLK